MIMPFTSTIVPMTLCQPNLIITGPAHKRLLILVPAAPFLIAARVHFDRASEI
jgi:hypothetical protein